MNVNSIVDLSFRKLNKFLTIYQSLYNKFSQNLNLIMQHENHIKLKFVKLTFRLNILEAFSGIITLNISLEKSSYG